MTGEYEFDRAITKLAQYPPEVAGAVQVGMGDTAIDVIANVSTRRSKTPL